MEWEFSLEDVVKGEARYGLENFRADLAAELRMNLAPASEKEFVRAYGVTYDLCHWLATGRSFPDFLVELGDDPAATRLAHTVREPMADNVAMLGAIMQRMIMDRVEAGMPLDAAVHDAAEEHGRIAANLPPRAGSTS